MKSFCILLAFSLLLGCASTGVVKLSNQKYPSVKPEQVQVFMAEQDVQRPYEKIAIITAEGDYAYQNQTSLIQAIQKKAAKLGANGLILGSYKEATTGEKVSNALLWTSANNKYQAIAIRLK